MGGSSSTASGNRSRVRYDSQVRLLDAQIEADKSSNSRPSSSGSKRSNDSKDSESTHTRYETTKVGIFLRCESLHRACRTFVVVYSKTTEESLWTEHGRTEVHEATKYPNYEDGIHIPFHVGCVQHIRLEVYRARDEFIGADLRDQGFLGSAETHLMNAVRARNEGTGRLDDGWLKVPLNSLKPNNQASICLWAEEEGSSKSLVSWRMKAQSLRLTDFWKGSVDPYVLLYRIDEESMHQLCPQMKEFQDFSQLKSAKSLASHASMDERQKAMPSLEDLASLGPQERKLVLKSSTVRKKRAPNWPERNEVSIQNLCTADGDHAIMIDVYDWYRVGEDKLIGSGITTFPEIYKAYLKNTTVTLDLKQPVMTKKVRGRLSRVASKKSIAKENEKLEKKYLEEFDISAKKPAGQLLLYEVNVLRYHTFMDYVRGGLELKLIVAVDCTRSNGTPSDPCSSHYIEGKKMNNYAATIQAAGEVFKFYAHGDDRYPMYGFGAKIPPTNTICSDCFALTGDWFMPEAKGVDGLVEAYHNGMRAVRFHGPTHWRRVLEVASDWSRPYQDVHTPNDNGVDMKYFVLLILSDGGVDDQKQVIDTILQAADLPLSIIIVDLGLGERHHLKDLNKEVEYMAEYRDLTVREMLHCVSLEDCWGKPRELIATALSKIPQHVSQYYQKKDVKPRGLEKFETKEGAPITRGKIKGPTANRRVSASQEKDINSAADALSVMQKKIADLEAHINKLPPFLRETRNKALQAARDVGYDPKSILRVLQDGVGDDTMAIFMDNMVHSGYGKCPTFKELVAGAPNHERAENRNPLDKANWHQPRASSMLEGVRASLASTGVRGSLASTGVRGSLASTGVRGSLASTTQIGDHAGSHAVSEFTPFGAHVEPPSPREVFPHPPSRPPSSALRMSREDAVSGEEAPLPGAIMDQPKRQLPTGFVTCTVCFEAPQEVAFVPCGHKVACAECAQRLGKTCPLCRTQVTGYKMQDPTQ